MMLAKSFPRSRYSSVWKKLSTRQQLRLEGNLIEKKSLGEGFLHLFCGVLGWQYWNPVDKSENQWRILLGVPQQSVLVASFLQECVKSSKKVKE